MRSSWSALAIVTALAAPAFAPVAAQAAPADAFAQFKRACVDAKFKPADWHQDGPATWSRPAPDGQHQLVMTVDKMDVGERRTCTLVGPANATADAQARAWAGQRPSGHDGDTTTYLLIDAAKKTPRTPSTEEARNWRNANRISGLAVSTTPNATRLSYASFTAKPVTLYREPFSPPPELNFSYAARIQHTPDSLR